MMTPAQRHKQKIEAREAAENAASLKSDAPVGDAYQVQLITLGTQKRQLKNIKSSEQRLEKKKQLYPEWLPYINGALEAQAGVPDVILAQMMVWAFDVEDIATAIRIGEYLCANKLPPPPQFVRSTPEIFAEMAAEAWLNHEPRIITLEQLKAVEKAVANADIVDEITAKLDRALGEAYVEHNDPPTLDDLQQAQPHLEHAIKLNARIGCKPLLASVEKQLKEQQQ